MEPSTRYRIGWETLTETVGKAEEGVIGRVREICPDLAKYIIEYEYGEIQSRDILDRKSREIAIVAALSAMGNTRSQLRVHLNGALNVGCSINEVKEILIQISAYSGFPSSINAINAFREVIAERKKRGIVDLVGEDPTPLVSSDRYATGARVLSMIDSTQVQNLEETYNDFCPDLVRFVIEYGYADIFSRDNLGPKYREIVTIAALSALGTAEPQLKFHINAGMNIGLNAPEIKEIMLLITVIAGFPSALNGINVLQQVMQERSR